MALVKNMQFVLCGRGDQFTQMAFHAVLIGADYQPAIVYPCYTFLFKDYPDHWYGGHAAFLLPELVAFALSTRMGRVCGLRWVDECDGPRIILRYL